MPGVKPSVMDPLPGQRYVEFSKDGGNGYCRNDRAESVLDVEYKRRIPKVEFICHMSKDLLRRAMELFVGDRLVAFNGKSVKKYASLDAIRDEFRSNNVVRLVVDPTFVK